MRPEAERLLLAMAKMVPIPSYCSGEDVHRLKEARLALEAALAAETKVSPAPNGPKEVHHAGNGSIVRTMDALDPHVYHEME